MCIYKYSIYFKLFPLYTKLVKIGWNRQIRIGRKKTEPKEIKRKSKDKTKLYYTNINKTNKRKKEEREPLVTVVRVRITSSRPAAVIIIKTIRHGRFNRPISPSIPSFLMAPLRPDRLPDTCLFQHLSRPRV